MWGYVKDKCMTCCGLVLSLSSGKETQMASVLLWQKGSRQNLSNAGFVGWPCLIFGQGTNRIIEDPYSPSYRWRRHNAFQQAADNRT